MCVLHISLADCVRVLSAQFPGRLCVYVCSTHFLSRLSMCAICTVPWQIVHVCVYCTFSCSSHIPLADVLCIFVYCTRRLCMFAICTLPLQTALHTPPVDISITYNMLSQHTFSRSDLLIISAFKCGRQDIYF